VLGGVTILVSDVGAVPVPVFVEIVLVSVMEVLGGGVTILESDVGAVPDPVFVEIVLVSVMELVGGSVLVSVS